METKKMTKREKQDILRDECKRMLTDTDCLKDSLQVGATDFAVAVPGEKIGLENQDCYVVVKLTVKNFEDTETQDAYDAITEAEIYQQEVEQKKAEQEAAKQKKAEAAAKRKARSESRKSKKKSETEGEG